MSSVSYSGVGNADNLLIETGNLVGKLTEILEHQKSIFRLQSGAAQGSPTEIEDKLKTTDKVIAAATEALEKIKKHMSNVDSGAHLLMTLSQPGPSSKEQSKMVEKETELPSARKRFSLQEHTPESSSSRLIKQRRLLGVVEETPLVSGSTSSSSSSSSSAPIVLNINSAIEESIEKLQSKENPVQINFFSKQTIQLKDSVEIRKNDKIALNKCLNIIYVGNKEVTDPLYALYRDKSGEHSFKVVKVGTVRPNKGNFSVRFKHLMNLKLKGPSHTGFSHLICLPRSSTEKWYIRVDRTQRFLLETSYMKVEISRLEINYFQKEFQVQVYFRDSQGQERTIAVDKFYDLLPERVEDAFTEVVGKEGYFLTKPIESPSTSQITLANIPKNLYSPLSPSSPKEIVKSFDLDTDMFDESESQTSGKNVSNS